MKKPTTVLFSLILTFAALTGASGQSTAPSVVRIETNVGNIDVQLYPLVAPKTEANFLAYVNAGTYNDSIIHGAVAGFIVQGGGYTDATGQITALPANGPVTSESRLPNVRGTLAMTLTNDNVNSATNQWFFNVSNNDSAIGSQGYTVFGSVINKDSLAVLDLIAALNTINVGMNLSDLPVLDYSDGSLLTPQNLVTINQVTALPNHPAFFTGELTVGNAVNYLTLSSGKYFGYYSYVTQPNYLFHFDLGWEYLFDAKDGSGGVYLYDFASRTFFYTSPSYPFPFMYDFTRKAVVYYYPDSKNPGHYTSNPRYFYDFNAKSVITK